MSCTTESKKNLGLSKCNEFPALIAGMIETEDSFVIPSATVDAGDAAVLTALQTAMLQVGNRAFNWPGFSKEPEDNAEEEQYQESALKLRQVRSGNQRWKFFVSENLCLHKNMQTHKRTSGRVFLIDINGYIIGTKKSNGDFAGLSLALLNPEKLKWATGSEVSESPIYVALSNSKVEFDRNGYMYDAANFVNEIYRIVDVELTLVGDNTATEIVVDVKAVCDGTGISGLLPADFALTDDDDGAAHAIATAPESTTVAGRYTLTGVAFEASKLNLRAASLLTIKAYESIGPLTIPAP